MSSRPPLPSSDSRFNQRDQSPLRYSDRRPSNAYLNPQSQRPSGPGSDVNPTLLREPPRGPKSMIDSSRSSAFVSSGSRGRGFAGRGDFRDRDRDRDFRDARDGPPFRRDVDRDWGRRDRDFDNRDSRIPFGRGRSRSPPLRDFRDSRDLTSRDVEISRLRRDSRDGPPSAGSATSDPPPTGLGSHIRDGSIRGRGRPDWDRGRGRSTFLDDREAFRPRSRSREKWWERERETREDRERDRPREPDRRERFDRREEDRRSDRDERDRLPERWKSDRPSSRSESRNLSGSLTTPATPQPQSTGSSHPASADKLPSKEQYDSGHRFSTTGPITPREGRRDGEKMDYFSSRVESSRDKYAQRTSSPPPSVPVPSFGSLPFFNPSGSGPGQSQGAGIEKPSPLAPATSKAPSAKMENVDMDAQAPIQPPTAPRAERVDSYQLMDSRDPKQSSHESSNKLGMPNRPAQPPSTPSMRAGSDSFMAGSPSYLGARELEVSPQSDSRQYNSWSYSTNAARPGSSSSQSFGRNLSVHGRATSPGPPPLAPSQPSRTITSPRTPFSQAPKGPRHRQLIPQGPKINQWVRPGYTNRGPSIMNTVPVKRDYHVEGRHRPLTSSKTSGKLQTFDHDMPHDKKPRLSPKQDFSTPDDLNQISALAENKQLSLKMHGTDDISLRSVKEASVPSIVDQSSEDVDDEEEEDFDEEDFANDEKKFEKEMEILASQKPTSPLRDPAVVDLLLKIQMLGMIVENAVPEGVDESVLLEEEAAVQPGPSELPSPKVEYVEDAHMEPEGRPLKEIPVNTLPTPPIESLPFLSSGSPPPFSEMEIFQENIIAHERIKDALRRELANQRKDTAHRHEDLWRDYANYYKPWRIQVYDIDRRKQDEKPVTPAPPSPPAMPIAVMPTPVIESRRGAKYSTEYDLQTVMKQSEETARLEQEARDREATARAEIDRDKEASIPDMLEVYERKALTFKDTNQIVNTGRALEVFCFIPPRDDFTEEEQTIFTDAYIINGKRFGNIAEKLPDRDYHQCVQHYYLTKEEAQYKLKCGKRTRRGRAKGPTARARPKSNALMSDLGVRSDMYEGDEFEVAAVTESGRPRRAAAPTFGDTGPDTENSTPGPTTARRVLNNKDSNGELSSDKPATKRGRAAGATRGQRRAKPQQPVSVAEVPSPQKVEVEPSVSRVRGLHLPLQRESTRLERPLTEEEMEVQEKMRNMKDDIDSRRGRDIRYPEVDGELLPKPGDGPYQSQQASSYWSVPEQREFPRLLAHFGKDFDAISAFMRTKTTIMVKNYFMRKVDQGKIELEDLALAAEARKQRGEPMGPPPMPNIAPKRRYDATPSAAAQRPLAPIADPMDVEDTLTTPKTKPALSSHLSPPPTGSQARIEYNKQRIHERSETKHAERADVRYQPLIHTSSSSSQASQLQSEEQLRIIRSQAPSQQRTPRGPQMGYFTADERREIRPAQPTILQEQQPQGPQPPLQQQEVIRPEQQMLNQQAVPPQRGPISVFEAQQLATRYKSTSQAISSQPKYLSHVSTQPSAMPLGHSRHLSSTNQGSPGQPILKQESDVPSLHRIDSFGQNPYAPSPIQSPISARPSSAISPTKDVPRPSSTPAQNTTEPPRQAPAKRSNIMSILNVEPEEPQRKRFGNDQPTPPANTVRAPSPPRMAYRQAPQQQQLPLRREEPAAPLNSQQQRMSYTIPPSHPQPQPQHQPPPSRSFSEYSAGFAGGPSNRSWLTRFDPRTHHGAAPSTNTPDQLSRLQTHVPSGSPFIGPPTPQAQQAAIMAQASQSQPQPGRPAYHQQAIGQHPLGHAANPSPPPQSQPGQVFRAPPSSSQHGRVPSYGHGQSLHQQQNIASSPSTQQAHSAGPASLPMLQRQHSGGYGPTPPPQHPHPHHQTYGQQQQQQMQQRGMGYGPPAVPPTSPRPGLASRSQQQQQPGRAFTPPGQGQGGGGYLPPGHHRGYSQGDDRR